ncbi:putative Nitrogen regulatory protein P-II [Pyrodictium delaneyi]|uniref:Putative Nitrogen regulatory protein P-II n=1 Tax=Pyrodictium delaneyi TaxID=1273541 RepID=A0A0P0N513_9CREN|nr:P-II family nitrogen regulator [Pyrodictium delaneyi]ALL01480.1 putative Nitrogen regulatory protein P-II [Pyrodictium delaneyi]OWJ54606.1 transcriptional regulator [Pyrodictium delaneyi]
MPLKKIEAVIRPEKLNDVKKALDKIGVGGLTVVPVYGRGRQGGIKILFRGGKLQLDLLPKVKIEVVVRERQVEDAVKAIVEAAKTGEEGDGKIFILPVEDAVRIRTGERGENVL